MALGELAGAWCWRRRHRELAARLHHIEMQLVELKLKVRDLEQQIVASDIDELRGGLRQRLPGPSDLPRDLHDPDVSKHEGHSDTSQ